MNIISQRDSSLNRSVLISTQHFLSIAGLEPYMVHGQPGPDPVFPEHSAGVGSLYLPVVVGPVLLPSSLLPWSRPYSDVLPLHRQNGETSFQALACFHCVVEGFDDWKQLKHPLVFFPYCQQKYITKCNIKRFYAACLLLPSRPAQVLGFLLASFGFVEFFYILLERSQEIQQHMVFLLSPIIRSMTVVNIALLCFIRFISKTELSWCTVNAWSCVIVQKFTKFSMVSLFVCEKCLNYWATAHFDTPAALLWRTERFGEYFSMCPVGSHVNVQTHERIYSVCACVQYFGQTLRRKDVYPGRDL